MQETELEKQNGLKAMLHQFFKLEAAAGLLLMAAAALALFIANTPLFPYYHAFLNNMDFTIGFADDAGNGIILKKSILLWVNDGLMAVFFLLAGLEIKREMKRGELSSRDKAVLPLIAAIGGMLVPALIYLFLNRHSPETLAGWAIPSATDIAFSLGVLALLGSRVPLALKTLLLAIAVIDDLGAILVIAAFYTSSVNVVALAVAGIALTILVTMNLRGVTRTAAFMLAGFIMWFALLKSGIHPTIAGVATAFCIPMNCEKNPDRKPLESLEHSLHPWVAYGILPLFALANAGVPFKGITFQSLFDPVTAGIIGGLFFGKAIGIFGSLVLAIKMGISPKPYGLTWFQLFGLAVLCGIGFTMSLFIGELAFGNSMHLQAEVRLGVLVGSFLSAGTAFFLLRLSLKK